MPELLTDLPSPLGAAQPDAPGCSWSAGAQLCSPTLIYPQQRRTGENNFCKQAQWLLSSAREPPSDHLTSLPLSPGGDTGVNGSSPGTGAAPLAL